jgi:hypothetical protein
MGLDIDLPLNKNNFKYNFSIYFKNIKWLMNLLILINNILYNIMNYINNIDIQSV